MKKLIHLIGIPMLLLWINAWSQEPEQSVFNAHRGNSSHWHTYQDNHRTLYRIISNEAFRLLDERAANVANLSNAEDWTSYQSKVKASLRHPLEKFKKSDLNSRITGTIERETYKVEKVLFESQPGFFVTAGLFIPNIRQHPAPAVIYCAGHTELGFRSETYQHVILNLVEKGFIVFAFDPLGQGERLQYTDPETGKSVIGGPTTEHSYAGIQTLLTGASLTDYFIWDGIRAIDYLESRPEVDMKRIGITGRSGGGTQAAMIAACDERIYAVAPENYITSFKRLLQSIGPQDAEQNPWRAIVNGIDHPDFLHLHAPKPALILTTTHDFFSIQGARETYAEARASFIALGKPDNLQMVEDIGGHQSTRKNRESLYAFFQQHLNQPGEQKDEEVTPFSYEELLVTPTGQISTSYTAETVFSLNNKPSAATKTKAINDASSIARIAGITFDRNLVAAVYTGTFNNKGIMIEKFFLEHDKKDYALPLYVLRKENSRNNKVIIWLHPKGKSSLLNDPLADDLMEEGYTIVTPDLPGTGELKDPDFTGDGIISGIPFNYTFGANLIGKSITGIQAESIDLLKQFIDKHEDFFNSNRYVIGAGTAAFPLIYFSCLRNHFTKAAFYGYPELISTLIETEYYNTETAWSAVPGSFPGYDLPDLMELLSDSGTEIFIQDKLNNNSNTRQFQRDEMIKFFNE